MVMFGLVRVERMLRTYLSQHPELAVEIEQKIRASAAAVSISRIGWRKR